MTQRIAWLMVAGIAGWALAAQAQTQPATLTPVESDGQAVPVATEDATPLTLTPAPVDGEATPLIPSAIPPADTPPSDIPEPQFPRATAPVPQPAAAEAPVPLPATTAPAGTPSGAPPAAAATTPAPDAVAAPTGDAATPSAEPENAAAPEEEKEKEIADVTDEDKKQASMLGYQPSYGNWPFSIMFRDKEISDIKKVLDYYEIQKYQASKNVDEQKQEALEQVEDILKNAPTTGAPLVYPVFQLRSLVYRSPRDWSVNVNRTTYSSRDSQDKKEASELKILALNDELVHFAWIPTNPQYYVDMLQKKLLQEQNMPTAGTATVTPLMTVSYKNRLAANASKPEIDDARRGVTFRLRPNQTVDLGSLDIYEGRPPNLLIPGDAKPDAPMPGDAPVAPVLPKDLQQQIDTGAPPDAAATATQTQAAPPASATTTNAITKEDTQGILTGKTSPKALIEKALQQEGSR